jgi:predicted transcriptional regulator
MSVPTAEEWAETFPEMETSPEPETALPAIVDAANFVALDLPEPPELVRGILHQGEKLAVCGGSKAFKTWTLADLAVSTSHALPWLSFPTVQGRVCFLNFEIQAWSWQRRIQAVAQAKGIVLQPGRFSLWNLRGKAANFDLLLPQIRERVKEDFSLIILDPIYKLYGQTDENKASDVANLLNRVEELTVSTGAAVAFGAHFSKGNQASKESIDRISGSGVFARDPDSLLVFTRHEEQNCFTVDATLRNFPPVTPFAVRWQYPLMQVDGSLDPARLKLAKGGRHKAHDPQKLLAAIADNTAENPISVSAWAKAAGIARQTLSEYLPELRAKGWIATVGEGSGARQCLTEKGREAARRALEKA